MIKIKHRHTNKTLFEGEFGSIKEALKVADLHEADLHEANLHEADLHEANLSRANLSRADLRGADLSGTNLQRADLSGTNLQRADLSGADLRGADLSGADLQRANLHEADLRWANLDFSSLPLWCGSFDIKVDDRLASQIFAHWARLDVSGCSPYVRYLHRVMISVAGKYMTNLFCQYRNDVKKI